DLRVDASRVWVNADATRLEQVVTNLVGNALKYTPAGGSVHVTLRAESGAAVLTVADTGKGIPAHLMPRVFDLFTQGPRDLDRSPGGLGIGLTLVKRIVELHGGNVDVRSEGEGRGSEFTVRLATMPAPAQVEQIEPAARDHSQAVAKTTKRRGLVVEDQNDMREVLRFA